MKLTEKKEIIREHYELDRPVTAREVRAEVKSLTRKRDEKKGFDDSDGILAAKLGII